MITLERERMDFVKKFFNEEEESLKKTIMGHSDQIKKNLIKVYFSRKYLDNTLQKQVEEVLNDINEKISLSFSKIKNKLQGN